MPKVKIEVKVHVTWDNKYSHTMEPDRHGRWARVALCGNPAITFTEGKIAHFQIAWIVRLPKINDTYKEKFHVTYYFPTQEKTIFDTLEEAKKAVERGFGYFIEISIGS